MSGQNEVGISPVLLQAITHTLSSNLIKHEPVDAEARPKILISKGSHMPTKVEPPGMLGSLGDNVQTYQSGNTIYVVQNRPEEHSVEPSSVSVPQDNCSTTMSNNGVTRQIIVPKAEDTMANGVPHQVEAPQRPTMVIRNSERNMGNVLSMLASQIAGRISQPKHDNKITQQEMYTTVTEHNSSIVPSPIQDVIVTQMDDHHVITETVVQTTAHDTDGHLTLVEDEAMPPSPQKVHMVEVKDVHQQMSPEVSSQDSYTEYHQAPESPERVRVLEVPNLPENITSGTTIFLNTGDGSSGMILRAETAEDGSLVYRPLGVKTVTVPSSTREGSAGPESLQPEMQGPCPICGDRITGYHYGIYTCESCKGFFKRTVQNKKTFVCHRKGECDVNIANRKKCPACRFKRCIVTGMKLEAIRVDRTRGGRSSYDGCSPHGRVKPLVTPRDRVRSIRPSLYTEPTPSSGNAPSPSNHGLTASQQTSALATMLKTPGTIAPSREGSHSLQPQTPAILDDLMAVESLMTDEDGDQSCCDGKLMDGDLNLFSSLLHLTDHCLYKIVRWARNLPDFASVSTDDQILLLQNCWAELLCICCAWKSLHTNNQLKIAKGRMLDLERAKAIGLAEVAQRLIDFTDKMRELELDSYEFVALKVMLLLSPDVKNLKDISTIRVQQDMLGEALLMYTSSHYPTKAGKFSRLLASLPELTRTCCLGKDQLSQRQTAGEVPQYSLLSELLKGDITMH